MFVSAMDQRSLRIDVVTGVQAILDRLAALVPAVESWGQSDELAELPFLFSVPVVPRRMPILVLLHNAYEASSSSNESLMGAVLLFAYAARFAGLRLLTHPDRNGRRCVFGPASDRTAIAVATARAMLQRNTALVSLPYRIVPSNVEAQGELTTPSRKQNAIAALRMMGLSPGVDWSLRVASRRLDLPLELTLDATLERVGRRTRRNLRAATRLCQRETGAELVWNPELSVRDLVRVNASSTHPVGHRVLDWRYATFRQEPGAFLAGLRGSGGEWLALAGGRRTGNSVTLDWQMNGKEFARYSVSLVMRGLLIARFGADGATNMRFEGGTAHTLASGFRTGAVYTLRVQRRRLWLRMLEHVLTHLFPTRAITRNLFGQRKPRTAAARE